MLLYKYRGDKASHKPPSHYPLVSCSPAPPPAQPAPPHSTTTTTTTTTTSTTHHHQHQHHHHHHPPPPPPPPPAPAPAPPPPPATTTTTSTSTHHQQQLSHSTGIRLYSPASCFCILWSWCTLMEFNQGTLPLLPSHFFMATVTLIFIWSLLVILLACWASNNKMIRLQIKY